MTTFDVFLSHAWVDQLSAERVAERPQRGLASELVRRLEAAGLSVFYDADDIHDGDQITDTARAALANSSAFVVWYSSMYPTRQACRWELTTATRIDREMERIIAINPEADGAHLTGTPLKDTRIAACPAVTDDAAWAALVDGVVSTVRAANDTIFGEIVETPVDWFPERQRPAVRFTGRLRELWKLHELLTAHALTGQQQAVGNAAVVDGLAGSGKTVLVLEYAQRYAPAWPGGVVWIKGHGYTQGSDVEVDQAAVQVLHRRGDEHGPRPRPARRGLRPGSHHHDLARADRERPRRPRAGAVDRRRPAPRPVRRRAAGLAGPGQPERSDVARHLPFHRVRLRRRTTDARLARPRRGAVVADQGPTARRRCTARRGPPTGRAARRPPTCHRRHARRHQRARRLREVVGANERRRGGRAGPPAATRESCSPRWPAMRRCRSR